jgi:hypothetical protein
VGRSLLIGGRFDGSTVPGGCEDFTWIGGEDRKPKRFKKPGPDRVLYRVVETEVGAEKLLCAHHTHRRCLNCRGWNDVGREPTTKLTVCQFCGEGLPTNAELCAAR